MAKPCTRYNMHLPHNTHHRHYNIHDYVAEQRLRLLLKLPDSVPIKEYLKRRNCYRSNKSALTKRAYSGIKSEVRPHLQKAKSEIQEKIKKIERESLVRDDALHQLANTGPRAAETAQIRLEDNRALLF